MAYALKTYSDDIHSWKTVHSAIEYIRQRSNPKRKEDSLDSLLIDLIKVYVLDSLTTTM